MAKQKTAEKPKMGRPTKFRPDSMQVEMMCRLYSKWNCTDKEVAEIMEVCERTLNNWKKKHPNFLQSINKSKAIANERVKRALYLRACGYKHPELKVFCSNGEVVTHETIKHYPPDTSALIFFLKNREREEFHDRRELTVDSSLSDEIAEQLDESGGIAAFMANIQKMKNEAVD